VFGGGFLAGATAKLTRAGQTDIVGSDVNASVAGFSLSVTFDLAGKALGTWDLVVMNPNGTSATLQNAITVEATRTAEVWVETLGHPAVKTDKPQLYTILYGNRGNVDANFVSVWVAFPQYLTWSLSGGPQPTSSVTTIDGNVLFLFDIPVVPPGSLGTIRFLLTTPPPARKAFTIWSWTKPL